jgi:uncharacterized protein with NRDE domain
MCLIAVLRNARADYPLVIAANRDELYARPATAPQILRDSPRVVGGRDEIAGGTWLAVNRSGFFAAVTNQHSGNPPNRRLHSRGTLVLDVASAGSIEAAFELLTRTNPAEYNGFNLLFGDAGRVVVAYGWRDAAAIEYVDVADGVHILPNDRLDAGSPKVARALQLVPDDRELSSFATMLGDHQRPPLSQVPDPPRGSPFSREIMQQVQALCIHTPGYGTRSSSIVALEQGGVARYLFAPGPPCTTSYEDVGALLV